MSRKFKVIGLALVVCAFGAVSATAQAAPQWTVEGKAITKSEAIAETILLTKVVSTESQPSATLTIPKLGITLTCTSHQAIGGQITPPNTGSASALRFTGCIVASAPNACQVKNTGGTVGTINTLGVTAELITNAKGTFAVFKPTGTNFVELTIEKKPEKTCAVSGNYAVTGAIALQVTPGTNATYLEGTASATVQTNAGAVLKFGGQEAILDATVDLALASDKNWGVDA